MICLGLETSCDETALALVSDGRLLGQALSSQEDLHAVFGGVVPELASREHQRKIAPLFSLLMERTGLTPGRIDAVAVARGPGLLGSLLVGLGVAKGLALGLGVPLVGVNHLHAHLTAAGLERPLEFPALGLLISGGHTHLYHIASHTEFELLGRTLDDAAGEALDKAAKMVNLPYPGGKHIDLLGRGVAPDKDLFPRGNVSNPGLDFSFSGLKSCVARHVAAHPELKLPSLPDGPPAAVSPELALFCASVNWAVADTLRIKAGRAMDSRPAARRLLVAGGVAANSMIRELLTNTCTERRVEVVFPSLALCTDNAAMIAYLGERLASQGLHHGLALEAVPRGRQVPLDYSR